MQKEQTTIETAKPEAQENHETPRSIEFPEVLRQQMMSESEKEAGHFESECAGNIAQAEARAEKDELIFEKEDKKTFQELVAEAEAAKAELVAEIGSEKKEPKELEHGSVEYYIQKSRIGDKKEALRRLMIFANVNSEQELRNRLKEKDEDGDNIIEIDMFTPNNLKYLVDPNSSLLRRLRDTGNALGYTFMNTPGYKSEMEDLVSKLKSKGEKEKAAEVEEIFAELGRDFEFEKEKSQFRKLDDRLFEILRDEDKLKEYVEKQKNLPPDATIYLYHGLNSGGYESALEILNGVSKGVEQRSGPTLSILPLGQFWKGVGFRYALRRDQIEFSGDNNSEAVVKMRLGDDGIEDTGYIIDKSGSLPLDRFKADVLRSRFTLPNPKIEEELSNKLKDFAESRAQKN
jgi:hypothetical protein